jgi:hypothetical protein
LNDPQATWEGLSVRPLGHRTYLATKVKGEKSMFGKPGVRETINRSARRDPDGKAKAKLLEPEYPNRKCHGLDTMVKIQSFHEPAFRGRAENYAPRKQGRNQRPKGYETGA